MSVLGPPTHRMLILKQPVQFSGIKQLIIAYREKNLCRFRILVILVRKLGSAPGHDFIHSVLLRWRTLILRDGHKKSLTGESSYLQGKQRDEGH